MKPTFLEYNLSPKVRAFSTTRLGGVGEGTYSEFNITHYCDDTEEHVRRNRQLLCQELGINNHQLFLPHQVHGSQILDIDDDFLKLDSDAQTLALEGVDAILTSIPHICVGVSTADCVPILLYEENRSVIAAIHAGWRGTLSRIVTETIAYLVSRYNCEVTKIKAIIGPSISLEAFEVGEEVYRAFRDGDFPMSSISKFYSKMDGDVENDGERGKWHLDLWAANCILLEECGVQWENIQVANVCTVANADTFFSARKLGLHSGRIFNGIMIR